MGLDKIDGKIAQYILILIPQYGQFCREKSWHCGLYEILLMDNKLCNILFIFIFFFFVSRKSITFSASPDKVVLNARQPWPSRVELPTNFRTDLADVLASKDSSKLTRKLRNAFIAHLYEHFSQYTM